MKCQIKEPNNIINRILRMLLILIIFPFIWVYYSVYIFLRLFFTLDKITIEFHKYIPTVDIIYENDHRYKNDIKDKK